MDIVIGIHSVWPSGEKRSVGLAKNIGVIGSAGPVYLSATCSPIEAADGCGRVIGGSVIFA